MRTKPRGAVPVISIKSRLQKIESQVDDWERVFGEDLPQVRAGRWFVAELRDALAEGIAAWGGTAEAAYATGYSVSGLQTNARRILEGDPAPGWEQVEVRREGDAYLWRLSTVPLKLRRVG